MTIELENAPWTATVKAYGNSRRLGPIGHRSLDGKAVCAEDFGQFVRHRARAARWAGDGDELHGGLKEALRVDRREHAFDRIRRCSCHALLLILPGPEFAELDWQHLFPCTHKQAQETVYRMMVTKNRVSVKLAQSQPAQDVAG
jgi:hypothetical protein